jgi:hypothetical protein
VRHGSRIAALLIALAVTLAAAPAALAQSSPGTPPVKATIFLKDAPPNAIFSSSAPTPKITIVLQIENVSGARVVTGEGFSSTDFFRRLYFTDPQGGTVTNKIEESLHSDSRVFMCLSRRRVLQAQAIPVAPAEVLPGPNTPPNFFREFVIDDARTLYDLTRPGRYSVNLRVPLLVFETTDPNAVIQDCDQLPGAVVNVTAVTGREEFTIVSNSLEFTMEATLPFTTATTTPSAPNASGWFTQDVTVNFSATNPSGAAIQRIVVETAGAQNAQQSLLGAQGTIAITVDGQTTITYHAEDSAGVIEDAKTLTVKLDKTAPVVSCAQPDALWHATDVTLACTATDNASGLASAADASFPLSTAVAAGTETGNASTASRSVCDVAGNCVTAGPIPGNRVDRKPPAIAITTPAASAVYMQGQTVLAGYSCTDWGSGPGTCAGPVASGSRIDTDTTGSKTFTVAATDAVGNSSSASVTYSVKVADSTPPTTTATPSPAPNGNGWNNTNVTVSLSAVDNPGGSGVKQITTSLSGAQTTGGGVTTGSSATVTITVEGTTTLAYGALDNAGNQEATKTLTVRIDKTKPVISGLPAPGCSIWPPNDRLVQIANVKSIDALSGLATGSPTVTVTSNERTQQGDIAVNGGVVQVRATRLGSRDGRVYTVTATATDKAGNVATATGTCTVPHDQDKDDKDKNDKDKDDKGKDDRDRK